jgi:hypothetical protein
MDREEKTNGMRNKRQRVVDFIENHPGATRREIGKGTGLYPMYADAVVRQMLEAGRIKITGRVKARNGRMAARFRFVKGKRARKNPGSATLATPICSSRRTRS